MNNFQKYAKKIILVGALLAGLACNKGCNENKKTLADYLVAEGEVVSEKYVHKEIIKAKTFLGTDTVLPSKYFFSVKTQNSTRVYKIGSDWDMSNTCAEIADISIDKDDSVKVFQIPKKIIENPNNPINKELIDSGAYVQGTCEDFPFSNFEYIAVIKTNPKSEKNK